MLSHKVVWPFREGDDDLNCIFQFSGLYIFSSDRSSCSDDGLLYIRPLFQIFTQSIDAIGVTSVTLSRLNSINAIDVTRYLGHILGIFWGYFGDILGIFWGYFGDILGIF